MPASGVVAETGADQVTLMGFDFCLDLQHVTETEDGMFVYL